MKVKNISNVECKVETVVNNLEKLLEMHKKYPANPIINEEVATKIKEDLLGLKEWLAESKKKIMEK